MCLSPGLFPNPCLYLVLTSGLRKDRKGIREFEALASAKREHGALVTQPNTFPEEPGPSRGLSVHLREMGK